MILIHDRQADPPRHTYGLMSFAQPWRRPETPPTQKSSNDIYEKKFTVPKACKLLGIGENKLRNMVKNRKIDYMDIDGAVRFTESQLIAYQNSNTKRANPVKSTEPLMSPTPSKIPPVSPELLKSSFYKKLNKAS